ncbi:MAG: hypothetical protein IAE63_07030 [Alphaproteobacteria bacterium]|nr:hypothetical protein [Alphaproteobacteria bacterium]
MGNEEVNWDDKVKAYIVTLSGQFVGGSFSVDESGRILDQEKNDILNETHRALILFSVYQSFGQNTDHKERVNHLKCNELAKKMTSRRLTCEVC